MGFASCGKFFHMDQILVRPFKKEDSSVSKCSEKTMDHFLKFLTLILLVQWKINGVKGEIECASGYGLDEISGRCYSVRSSGVMYYAAAKAFCAERNGHLPAVKSAEDMSYFVDLRAPRAPGVRGQAKGYWLGAMRKSGDWFWEVDGSPLTLTNWYGRNPDLSQDRAKIHTFQAAVSGIGSVIIGMWNDVYEDRQEHYAICQREPEIDETTTEEPSITENASSNSSVTDKGEEDSVATETSLSTTRTTERSNRQPSTPAIPTDYVTVKKGTTSYLKKRKVLQTVLAAFVLLFVIFI